MHWPLLRHFSLPERYNPCIRHSKLPRKQLLSQRWYVQAALLVFPGKQPDPVKRTSCGFALLVFLIRMGFQNLYLIGLILHVAREVFYVLLLLRYGNEEADRLKVRGQSVRQGEKCQLILMPRSCRPLRG